MAVLCPSGPKLDDGFPNVPLFQRLVNLAQRDDMSRRVVVKDLVLDRKATLPELLVDALRLRQSIYSVLSIDAKRELEEGKDIFICLCLDAGYHWYVAILAIQSLGAAAVLLSPAILAEEAQYFISTTKAAAFLFSSKSASLAKSVSVLVDNSHDKVIGHCRILGIRDSIEEPPNHRWKLTLSTRTLNPNGAGYVMFTSGTTGPPKGVVHYRKSFLSSALGFIERNQVVSDDIAVDIIPGYLITGIFSRLCFLLSGACSEIPGALWNPEWMWNRLKTGSVNRFFGAPSIFRNLTEYYWKHIAEHSPGQVEEYTKGLQCLKAPTVGGSYLSKSIREAWDDIPGSHGLRNSYGLSETGPLCGVPESETGSPSNYLGRWVTGVDVKLSDGEQGELLIKSPDMFKGYLNSPELTQKAFDSDGFYRTGDYVRREGSKYFIEGRISGDIIRWAGYKILAQEVEEALSGISYIQEAMVVPVVDEALGQRVAAIVRPIEEVASLSLSQLRRDLYSNGLAAYKLPRVLGLARPDETLPRSPFGKPLKAKAISMYFPDGYQIRAAPSPRNDDTLACHRIQIWTEEEPRRQKVNGIRAENGGQASINGGRLWDWAGLQP